MTAEQLLRAMVANPMQSTIMTTMSGTNIATNLKRLQDKHLNFSKRDFKLTESLKEKFDEHIPLEQKRQEKLAELEQTQSNYDKLKEEVDVLDLVMAADTKDIMDYRTGCNDLGILTEVLKKIKDTPLEKRPWGKQVDLPIEQIRSSVGCPTPESCSELSYFQCVAINFIFLLFGYATHPTLTGLWNLPPNGNKQVWIDMYGETAKIKTRKTSLSEMQLRIHDYLGYVSAVRGSSNSLGNIEVAALHMNMISTDCLAAMSAEYKRRVEGTNIRHDEHTSEGNGGDESRDDDAPPTKALWKALPLPRAVMQTSLSNIPEIFLNRTGHGVALNAFP